MARQSLCDVKTSLSKPAGGSTGLDGGLGDVEGLGDAEEGGGAGGLVESVELVTSEVLFEDEVAAVEVASLPEAVRVTKKR